MRRRRRVHQIRFGGHCPQPVIGIKRDVAQGRPQFFELLKQLTQKGPDVERVERVERVE